MPSSLNPVTDTFGTVIITKDRNWCLETTVRALKKSELTEFPIVVVNNGSSRENPLDVLKAIRCEYIHLPVNTGIVGARLFAHHVAKERGWTRYCFLQDDFELKLGKPWLLDTLEFMAKFKIDFCRLTTREAMLGENEHWVKGVLRIQSKVRFWNCSHIQSKKPERVGQTEFSIGDKHYCDWAHIMSSEASGVLFDIDPRQLKGPTVTDLLTGKRAFEAFEGALRSEFDIAVKHWIAYSMGMISATGVVEEPACWSGAFDHFTGKSTCDYRDLPPDSSLVFTMLDRVLPSAPAVGSSVGGESRRV